MTPDQARDLLDGTTPVGEWYYRVKWGSVQYIEPVTVIPGGEVDVTEEDAALIVAAPVMAAMIAGMREEWGVSWDDDPSGNSRDWGFPTRAAAERWEKANRRYGPGRGHVVRRYVTEPEEA